VNGEAGIGSIEERKREKTNRIERDE